MGLSNEERFKGICECVHQMQELEFTDTYNYECLTALLDKLWPSLLSSQGNSAHWILGGSLDANWFGETALVTAAFNQVLEEFDKKDSILPEVKDFDYLDQYRPAACSLLIHEQYDGRNKSNLYKLFKLTETFFYYANRYQDEFSERLNPIKEIVSKIQGFCYERFSRDSSFFKAYMAESVFGKILPYSLVEEDVVFRIFKSEYLHHDCRLDHVDNDYLYKLWKKLRLKSKIKSQERLEIILVFVGNKLHYAHKHKKILKELEKHNQENPNDIINLKRISNLLNKKIKAHEKKKTKKETIKRYCALTHDVG